MKQFQRSPNKLSFEWSHIDHLCFISVRARENENKKKMVTYRFLSAV